MASTGSKESAESTKRSRSSVTTGRPLPNLPPHDIKDDTLNNIVLENTPKRYVLITELRGMGLATGVTQVLDPAKTVNWHIEHGLWHEAAEYLEQFCILHTHYKKPLKRLFKNGTTSEIAGERSTHETHMGSTRQQMVMAGVEPVVYSHSYDRMPPYLDFRKYIEEENGTWGEIKKYYSWITGVKMHREPEDDTDSEEGGESEGDASNEEYSRKKNVLMSLVGNEDEHVLPVGFMLLFGGGLAKKLLEGVMREPVLDGAARVGRGTPLFGALDTVAFEEAKAGDLQHAVEVAIGNAIDDYYVIEWDDANGKRMGKAYDDMVDEEIKQFLLQNGLVNRFLSSSNPKAKNILQRIKGVNDVIEKEGTDRLRLLKNIITQRQGVNIHAKNLLDCMYKTDINVDMPEEEDSITEFLLYQIKLNYYGYFLSEGKANRIKSDNIFLKITNRKNGVVRFEPSDHQINTFLFGVDAFLGPFMDQQAYEIAQNGTKRFKEEIRKNENRKNAMKKRSEQEEEEEEFLYSDNSLTEKTCPSGWESGIHYHKVIAKENIRFILEKLSFYLNKHLENRIFFNIIMSQLNLDIEEKVESTNTIVHPSTGRGDDGASVAYMVSDGMLGSPPRGETNTDYTTSPGSSQPGSSQAGSSQVLETAEDMLARLEQEKEEEKRQAVARRKTREKLGIGEGNDNYAENAFDESSTVTPAERQSVRELKQEARRDKEYSKDCHKDFVRVYWERNSHFRLNLQKVEDPRLIKRFLELGIIIAPAGNKSPQLKKPRKDDPSSTGGKKKKRSKKKRTKKKGRKKKKTRGKR
jgi:hypothetical protein